MASHSADDSTLVARLAEAGIGLTAEAVEGLVAGAAAAPVAEDAQAWMHLIASDAVLDAVPGLREALQAWRDALVRPAPQATLVERAARLKTLRFVLKRRGLAGFVVPRADPHLGEFLPLAAERLAWLTGFTGSAGTAVVLDREAALFVDGRYTLQVREQADGALYQFRHLTDEPPVAWIAATLEAGGKLGFDPWLHSPSQAAALRRACEKAGGELTAVSDNPIDALWTDRPPAPLSPMVPYPLVLAGEDAVAKRRRLAEALVAEDATAAFIAAPDSVAWLLNVRGADVPFTPLSLAFVLLNADASVDLYVDGRKVSAETRAHLGDKVRLHEPDALGDGLDRLGCAGATVWLDREAVPAWAWHRLNTSGARLVDHADPCVLPRALKNATELEGMRAAHRRDGVAMVRFLAWLDGAAPDGTVTERMAAARLEGFRRDAGRFHGPSFETISGAGPNGAIVHYRCTEASDRTLAPGTLYLVDSGGQYDDGTTDITRTVAIGEPSPEMRERFTRVLQGHIALATTVFPRGTAGPRLDSVARRPLWKAGLDYDHGTGHGVGCFLGVHEGPARIAKTGRPVALEPGMVLSNEPGYYREGAYGIRIENLVVVEERPAIGADGQSFLGFETLTLVPLDRRLIVGALLSADERAWVDSYHQRVRDVIAPVLDPPTCAWLDAATAPLGWEAGEGD